MKIIKILYVTFFGLLGLILMTLKNTGTIDCNWFVTTLPLTGSAIFLLIMLVIGNYAEKKYKNN